MTERPPRKETKPSTVPEAIARLASATENLRGEIERFRALLKDFGRIPERAYQWSTGPELSTQTNEPKSHIRTAERTIQAAISPEAQMTLIKALARDLDGAFRDIRAARANVEAIVETPEARDRFRQWHKKR